MTQAALRAQTHAKQAALRPGTQRPELGPAKSQVGSKIAAGPVRRTLTEGGLVMSTGFFSSSCGR